jgi:hypothetical protein
MNPEDSPMTQETIERMRLNEQVLAKIAKILKCYPDQVQKELAKMFDRMAQIQAVLAEWEGKAGG